MTTRRELLELEKERASALARTRLRGEEMLKRQNGEYVGGLFAHDFEGTLPPGAVRSLGPQAPASTGGYGNPYEDPETLSKLHTNVIKIERDLWYTNVIKKGGLFLLILVAVVAVLDQIKGKTLATKLRNLLGSQTRVRQRSVSRVNQSRRGKQRRRR